MAEKSCDKEVQSADDVSRGCCLDIKQRAKCPANLIIISVCLCIGYFILGIGATLLGATVVHLERLFDADTASVGFVFPATSIGGLIGSVVCGVVYDRVVSYRELTFSLVNFLSSITIIAAPFVGDVGGLPAFIAMVLIWTIPKGYYYTGCSSYVVNMWDGYRLRDSVVQATFALWSLGAAIGPIIIQNFLVELPVPYTTIATPSDNNVTYTLEVSTVTTAQTDEITAVTDQNIPIDVSYVRFAFVVVGSLEALPALMFLAIHIFSSKLSKLEASAQQPKAPIGDNKCEKVDISDVECGQNTSEAKTVASSDTSRSSVDTKSQTTEETPRTRFRRLYILTLVLVFLFYTFQMFVEDNFMSYLTSFAIKYTGWSVKAGADVMAIYYVFQGGTLVLSVVISAVVRPQTILIVDLIITTISCLLLLLIDTWPDILWVSAALTGLGTACTFGAMILWMSHTIAITGLVSAVVMLGTAVGNTVGPLVVGQLFDTVTPLAFVYMSIASIIAVAVTIAVMFAFNRRYGKELRSGSAASTNSITLASKSSSDETVDANTVTNF